MHGHTPRYRTNYFHWLIPTLLCPPLPKYRPRPATIGRSLSRLTETAALATISSTWIVSLEVGATLYFLTMLLPPSIMKVAVTVAGAAPGFITNTHPSKGETGHPPPRNHGLSRWVAP